MPFIISGCAFAGTGEWLAGARTRPNRSRPFGKLECELPSGDASEEMATVKSGNIAGFNFRDGPLIDFSRRNQIGADQLAEPCGDLRIVFVVVRSHKSKPRGVR